MVPNSFLSFFIFCKCYAYVRKRRLISLLAFFLDEKSLFLLSFLLVTFHHLDIDMDSNSFLTSPVFTYTFLLGASSASLLSYDIIKILSLDSNFFISFLRSDCIWFFPTGEISICLVSHNIKRIVT